MKKLHIFKSIGIILSIRQAWNAPKLGQIDTRMLKGVKDCVLFSLVKSVLQSSGRCYYVGNPIVSVNYCTNTRHLTVKKYKRSKAFVPVVQQFNQICREKPTRIRPGKTLESDCTRPIPDQIMRIFFDNSFWTRRKIQAHRRRENWAEGGTASRPLWPRPFYVQLVMYCFNFDCFYGFSTVCMCMIVLCAYLGSSRGGMSP